MTEAQDRVRAQYGRVGDAYVRSVGHATGDDRERMLHHAAPQPSDTLLDIATGGGHVARVIGPHVGRVIVSDLTPEMLDHALPYLQQQGVANVERLVADAQALPLEDESVDIATCRIAPHHFPEPDRFVAEAARVLRPGGRCLLVDSTVPEGEIGAFFNAYEKVRDPSHVRSLTESEWVSLLTRHGLKIDAIEPFRKRHEFGEWTDRMQVDAEDRETLRTMMRSAGEKVHQAFEVVFDDQSGDVVSWVDTKTLFAAYLAVPQTA
ncbi:class I SAM-dependent methyltransferase [soil metagenome]